jgi:hypothetical protein
VRKIAIHGSTVTGRTSRRLLATISCACALLGAAQAAAAVSPGQPGSNQNAAATLEQCVAALTQAERSATFSGEMAAIPGSTHMAMRIEVFERLPGELVFHTTVLAPGLSVWRSAAPGVKVYRYLKQVTNLTAPAVYRAAIRFRWMSPKGRVIKVMERRTPICAQRAPRPSTPAPAPATAG